MRDKYRLYRCKFVKETDKYIIARDIFNDKKYYVSKNSATSGFKIGSDSSFYAVKRIEGTLVKKRILEAVEYEKVVQY